MRSRLRASQQDRRRRCGCPDRGNRLREQYKRTRNARLNLLRSAFRELGVLIPSGIQRSLAALREGIHASPTALPPALADIYTGGLEEIEHLERAPISSHYFLQDVDSGLLDGSSIFRIVTSTIEVVQMGLCERDPGIRATLEHEPTRQTGLFVCMRDEPALDQGGARNPDGLGFAAFGRVIAGFEDLRRLFVDYARGRGEEYLQSPIRLVSLRRKSRTIVPARRQSLPRR
jgi:peptidyl-prolyl cis-trans isomerase A (cyclophilin A)